LVTFRPADRKGTALSGYIGLASDTGSTEAPERRRYTRIGIRNALVLSFRTLIFVAISALLALNLWSGWETALQLLREQIQISVDLLENRVVAHVAPVIAANRDMAEAINSGTLSPKDTNRIITLWRSTMSATPQISAMALIDPNGVSMRFARGKDRFGMRKSDWSGNAEVRAALNEARKRGNPIGGGLSGPTSSMRSC